MIPQVAVLGSGRVSQSITQLLARASVPVRVWGHNPPSSQRFASDWPQARWCDSLARACEDADVIIFTVPVDTMRQVARDYSLVARGDQVVLHVARGVERQFVLPHQILRDETCVRKIAVLGGPLQEADVHAGQPLAAVVASRFDDAAQLVRRWMPQGAIVVHPSRDMVGVEVAAAIANVTHIAIGMAAALELGETARGVLLTRGLGEAARIGIALGARVETFTGLAGVGALIPRPAAALDRHHAFGRQLAEGAMGRPQIDLNERLDGVLTVQEAVLLADKRKLDVPLLRAVAAIIAGEIEPRRGLTEVMHRGLDFGASLQRFTPTPTPLRSKLGP